MSERSGRNSSSLSRRRFLEVSVGAVVATSFGCAEDDGKGTSSSNAGPKSTTYCSTGPTSLEELGEVVSTDVLIIGGGIGGLVAAVKAKETNPKLDVLIVEKQTAGWAGKATKIGGVIAFIGPNNNADKFLDFQIRVCGRYLNNQLLLTKYVQETQRAVAQLGEWGVALGRDQDGNLISFPNPYALEYSMGLIDIDLMLPIRAKAVSLKTRILNKIHVTDLVKQGDRIVGAVGFNIVTGRFCTIKAKATVLANGSCGYKVRRFWVAGTGDGVAAAFRAGAEMRNAEYGNLYGHVVYQDSDSGMVDSSTLVNAQGEGLISKYVTDTGPTGVFVPVELALGLEKEVLEGKGPIYSAPLASAGGGEATMGAGLPKITDWMQRLAAKEAKYGLPVDAKRALALPLHAETSCIKVDPEMKTSLEGLWAIGDTSYAGSAVAGAMAAPPGVSPGSGIMFAVISAAWAGPSAAQYAASVAASDVDACAVSSLKENTFGPLQRSQGLLPEQAISALQEVTAPMKYNLRRSEERLTDALSRVEELKQQLPELQAKDLHYLSKCHEVKSMTVCAELTHRAALARTESRGFHYREDHPVTDNANWLKWVILREDNGKVAVSTQSIPLDEYSIKPNT